MQFTLKKITCCAKKREKNNLSRGKIPDPPLDIKWSVPYCSGNRHSLLPLMDRSTSLFCKIHCVLKLPLLLWLTNGSHLKIFITL